MKIDEIIKNERFFAPLSSKNRIIYFDCINRLIEKNKQTPLLHDSDARDAVALVLRNEAVRFVAENEEETADTTDQSVSIIMRRFRECGWLSEKEIGRDGENMTGVTTNCRKFIDFINKLGEKKVKNELSNHILSMYEILKAMDDPGSARKDKPYTLILVPLLEHEESLKEELLDLRDGISSILLIVQQIGNANMLGRFMNKDQLLDEFFSDYFFLKNNGLIPLQLREIRNMLRRLSTSTIRDKMIEEYFERSTMDRALCTDEIDASIEELRTYLAEEYEANIRWIDERINQYYDIANRRFLLVMSSGLNLQSALDECLSGLKDLEGDARAERLELFGTCVQLERQQFISPRSFEKRQRNIKDLEHMDLCVNELSEEERAERTRALFESVHDRFSAKKTQDYFDAVFHGQKEITLSQQRIESRYDALMYMSALTYSSSQEFGYEAQLLHEDIELGFATISNMKLHRKEKRDE